MDIAGYALMVVPCFLRAAGLLILIPVGFGENLSSYFSKAVFALLLAGCALPFIAPQLSEGAARLSTTSIIAALPGNFLTGVLLSLPAVAIVECAKFCAESIETTRGQTTSTIFDPLTGVQYPALGLAVERGLWAVLFFGGLGPRLLGGLISSFNTVTESGGVVAPSKFHLLSSYFAVSVRITVGLLVPLLLLEFCGATLERISQISGAYGVTFALKSVVLFTLFALGLSAFWPSWQAAIGAASIPEVLFGYIP